MRKLRKCQVFLYLLIRRNFVARVEQNGTTFSLGVLLISCAKDLNEHNGILPAGNYQHQIKKLYIFPGTNALNDNISD
mgnify:CR=1 FL=1